MSTPAVWDDARARIELGAAQLGIPVAWPNEQFAMPQPFEPATGQANLWIAASIRGDLSEPYEIEGGIWEETGTVEVHVMLPTTAGIRPGLVARKALANLFRGVIEGPVTYRSAILDAQGIPDEDGNWVPLTLRVTYSYQDIDT